MSDSFQRPNASRLVLLASLAALGVLATNIMLPAFPLMARELDVDPRELALTLSVFFVVFAVGQLFVGPYAAALGRQPFVFAGLAALHWRPRRSRSCCARRVERATCIRTADANRRADSHGACVRELECRGGM